MPGVLPALDFLAAEPPAEVPGVCALFGDEPFLKSLVLGRLKSAVLGDDDGEFSFSAFEGEECTLAEVFDCLSTRVMFGSGRRLAAVSEADSFVTRHRAALEDYVARAPSGGVLVLDVATWPSNTKLYKAVAAAGLSVDCKAPPRAAVIRFLTDRAKHQHRARLERAAAELLLETVGSELGLLDQELAKLALSVGIDGKIEAPLVTELVGGWRAKTTWDMLDLALSGDAAAAVVQLERLLLSGENPVAILAQIGSTLRRFAAATRLIEQAERSRQRLGLRQALEGAGFRSFVVGKAEAQLRQLGRQRAGDLYHEVLEADLALKGTSSAPARARTVLETMIVHMSAAAAPA